jgi:hypothetical protein
MQFRVTILAALFGLAGLIGGVASGGCGDDGGFPRDAPMQDRPANGTVSLAWSLQDLNGQAIQCDQVGASTVSLQLRARGELTGAAESFTCTNSPSKSKVLDPGTYDVSFELHAGNVTLAVAADQGGVVIEDGKDTALTPISFVVDARGGLVLSLAAPPATTNCKSPSMMGAGINGVTITLMTAAGGCAQVTFVHKKGAVTLAPYTVNCSSPAVAACIENDETLTVPSLASGPYTIHVRGKIGAVECWKNDDALQVPALGKALTTTVNLAFQTGTTGC